MTDHTPEHSRATMLRWFLENEAENHGPSDWPDDDEDLALCLEIWRETGRRSHD